MERVKYHHCIMSKDNRVIVRKQFKVQIPNLTFTYDILTPKFIEVLLWIIANKCVKSFRNWSTGNNVDLDLWPCIMKLFAWFTMIFHMSKRKYIANKPEESCCDVSPFSACFCAFLAFWNNRISTNWSTHIMIWINWTMKFSCGFMILKFNNSYWKLIHRLFAYQYLSKQLYWIKELVKFNSVKTIEYLFHLGPLSYPLHPGPQSPHFLLCTIQRDDVIWTELFATLKWRSIENYIIWTEYWASTSSSVPFSVMTLSGLNCLPHWNGDQEEFTCTAASSDSLIYEVGIFICEFY